MIKNQYEQAVFDILTKQDSPESSQALYDKHCSDDCLWENTGFPPAKGREQINLLLKSLYDNDYYSLDQTVRHMMSDGNVVMAERYEKMLRKDGSVIAEFMIVGVFEFDDNGQICAWRDYYDFTIAQKAFL
ncbi:MAG: nuclear transport factor 2 family protein [Porticoccaceae bacterium]|nr:nuclear transport factor 2 family protein [Porticoccaceae bacterium]